MKAAFDLSQISNMSRLAGTFELAPGLESHALAGYLPEESLGEMAARCHVKTYECGQVLCHQGDVAHSLWLVLGGWVKLTRETLEGVESVWDVVSREALVGLETLMKPHEHLTRAVTVSEVSALVIPHSILRKAFDATPAFAAHILEQLVRQHQTDRLELEHRAHQSAPQRIGCYLLKLAGTPVKGEARLELPFDKGLLAARLGMQPETFSRGLAKLKAETGLQMRGGEVVIPDVKLMEAYTCHACSGIYPCGH